jgi:hypothetical protein
MRFFDIFFAAVCCYYASGFVTYIGKNLLHSVKGPVLLATILSNVVTAEMARAIGVLKGLVPVQRPQLFLHEFLLWRRSFL